MDGNLQDQIGATIGEQAHNVAVGKDITQFNLTIETTTAGEQATASTRTAYLNWLIDRNRYLDPRGTQQTTRQVQLKLDEVYISLQAQLEESQSKLDRRLLQNELAQLKMELADLPAVEQEDRRDHLYARFGLQQRETVSTAPVDLNTAVEHHDKLVILGDPGSGKTTLLRYLALQNALALRDNHLADAENSSSPALGRVREGFFPILVRVADYAEDGAWKEHALSAFLAEVFKRTECDPPGLADLLQRELAEGGCLVLLDGLDEIVEADDRRGVVQRLEDFIRRHDRGGHRGKNRFIVTSRIAGYRSAPLVGSGGEALPHYVVQEMDDEQIGRFLERWCRAVEDFQTPDVSEEARQATAQREIDGIHDAVKKNPGVRRLAGNPLMLRVLALIHRTGARLPQKRVELYRLAADTLARTWRTAQGVPESALVSDNNLTPLLGQLAYWMHEHKPSGIATEREVYEQLGAAFAKRNRIADWDTDDPDPVVVDEIDKFLLAVREHTGLFVERAPKRYGFMHLTFEEYYAARHLVARSRTRAQLIRQHLHDARWEEPILLALGFVGLDYPDEAAELVETAILAQGDEAEELRFQSSEYEELLGRDYLFALRCLGDDIPVDRKTLRYLLDRLFHELLLHDGLAIFSHYRVLLDERLASLGDSSIALEVATFFTNALQCDDSLKWVNAVRSLDKLENIIPDVRSVLRVLINVDDENIRFYAAAISLKTEYVHPQVSNYLIELLANKDPMHRLSATELLGKLRSFQADLINNLIWALNDDDSFVRESAKNSLAKLCLSSKDIKDFVISHLHFSSSVRLPVLANIRHFTQDLASNYSIMLALLIDEDRYIRIYAAAILFELGECSDEVLSILFKAVHDSDWSLRYRAVQSIGTMASVPNVTDKLIWVLNNDDNWVIRALSAKCLGSLALASELVKDSLATALNDRDWNVRSNSAASLISFQARIPEITKAFIESIQDSDLSMRSGATEALGELGQTTQDVIDALTCALEDNESIIRLNAAKSLYNLGKISNVAIDTFMVTLENADYDILGSVPIELLGLIGKGNVRTINILMKCLLMQNGVFSEASDVAFALSQLIKRFPALRQPIIERIMQSIQMSYSNQDRLYEALWRVVAE